MRSRRIPRTSALVSALAVSTIVGCGSTDDAISGSPGSAGPTASATPPAVVETTTPAPTPGPATDAARDTDTDPEHDSETEQRYPDVVDAVAVETNGVWRFDVTISSPYDTPERYADGWRILGPDGTEYGFRLLTHDHANEQPFTRSLSDVEIPDGVDVVTIEGRDQRYGFGGTTFDVILSDD